MAPGRKTGGRKRGSLNKVNADLKAMIQGALADAGGREYLVEQAKANPGAFLMLIGKILPRDVVADVRHGGTIKHKFEFVGARGSLPDS